MSLNGGTYVENERGEWVSARSDARRRRDRLSALSAADARARSQERQFCGGCEAGLSDTEHDCTRGEVDR